MSIIPERKFSLLMLIIVAILVIAGSLYYSRIDRTKKEIPDNETVQKEIVETEYQTFKPKEIASEETGGLTGAFINYSVIYGSLFSAENSEEDPAVLEKQTEETVEQFVKGIDISEYLTDFKVYKNIDIKTDTGTGLQAKKDYGNNVALIINKELSVINTGTESTANNPEKMERAFLNINESMQKIGVPTDIRNIHLDLLNSSSFITAILNDYAGYDQDPVQTEIIRYYFKVGLILFTQSYAELKNYYEKEGIVFLENENGFNL